MGGTVRVAVHQFFPPFFPSLLTKKKTKKEKEKNQSIVPMMRQTGVEGREEGRGTEVWTRVEKKKNDSKFLCSLFW